MKTKTINKVAIMLVLAMLIMISSLGILFSTNIASAEEAQSRGVVIVGDAKGSGTYDDPYVEKPWNGRITSKENIFDNYFIEINVDPRDSMFGDDVIIEYKHYYVDYSTGKRIDVKLQNFHANITFHETHKGVGKNFYLT